MLRLITTLQGQGQGQYYYMDLGVKILASAEAKMLALISASRPECWGQGQTEDNITRLGLRYFGLRLNLSLDVETNILASAEAEAVMSRPRPRTMLWDRGQSILASTLATSTVVVVNYHELNVVPNWKYAELTSYSLAFTLSPIGLEVCKPYEWMNEWKCEDFKCVWKPTESRLCLTHYVNKSSCWAK